METMTSFIVLALLTIVFIVNVALMPRIFGINGPSEAAVPAPEPATPAESAAPAEPAAPAAPVEPHDVNGAPVLRA